MAVPLHLFGHIPEGVRPALAVKFVDDHHSGEIQHVDLLQLAGGAEFRRHHIQGLIHKGNDAGVPLPDAGGLHKRQVETGHLDRVDDVRQGRGDFSARPAGGEGAHEDVVVVDGVHAQPIPQQGPAGLAARGVYGQHGDPEGVAAVQAKAADDLVGEGRLARPAGAGDA